MRFAGIPGRYYDATALLGAILLQPWFFVRGAVAKPSAVHAMDLDTALTGFVLARCLRVPFVYQCLDPYYAALPPTWPAMLGRFTRWLEDRVISAADLFVITDLRRLPQHPSASPHRLVEMVNAPLEDAHPRRHGDGRGALVVGYIGSLVPHRNLLTIIRTIGAMDSREAALVIGGFGPLEKEIEAECRGLTNVDYIGWVNDADMPELQSSFDVFIQVEDPSHTAYRWVSPNKLFDSMAFCRPIIVAEGTLAAETVAEVGHGLAVPYGDSLALEQAIRRLRNNPGERAKMADAGHHAYLLRWSPDQQRERVLGAYAAVLDGAKPTGTS